MLKIADSFYLADGTVLAIQLGHRKSDDIDLFSQKRAEKKDFFDAYEISKYINLCFSIKAGGIDMWQLKQLERLHEIEPDTVDNAIAELLNKEPKLREKLIVGAYIDGEINLGKAAELLRIHSVKLRGQLLSKGIPVRIGVETIEEIVVEGIAARGIRESTE